MTAPLTIVPGSSPRLVLHGDWTLPNYGQLARAVTALSEPVDSLDATGLSGLDTAGASLLVDVLGAERLGELVAAAAGLSDERRALLLAVAESVATQQ